jgi:hypothetical protein
MSGRSRVFSVEFHYPVGCMYLGSIFPTAILYTPPGIPHGLSGLMRTPLSPRGSAWNLHIPCGSAWNEVATPPCVPHGFAVITGQFPKSHFLNKINHIIYIFTTLYKYILYNYTPENERDGSF